MPVWNRESILELLTRELARSDSSGKNLSVLLVGIDPINRNRELTESQSSTVAAEIAKRLSLSLRPYDYIGRYSQNQFLVLAPELEPVHARALGEKLRESVADSPIESQGYRLRITISLAVAGSSDFTGHDQSEIMHQLEGMLGRIQASGGNKCESLGAIISSRSRPAAHRRRVKTSWLVGGAAALVVIALLFLAPSWTCAPNLVSDLLNSGELPPPLPNNCTLTTEKPSDAIFESLEKQREAGELELQETVVCKIAAPSKNRNGAGREQQWLGSLYTDGRLQYRRHVLLAASQDVPGGKLFAVEQCITPWWKYITQSKEYCRTQNLPWE